MLIYRLTLMMADGTRFISDYEDGSSARSRMLTFFKKNDEAARTWKEGAVEVIVNLDKVISASVRSMDVPTQNTTKGQFINGYPYKIPQNFAQTVHIGTIHMEKS